MRVGVRLVQYLGSPREVVKLAVAAERAGIDEVWIPHDPFMSHAWTITSAIAAATERVVVGAIGTNPYTIDASEIATHLATLDLLSGGRAALGVGLHTGRMVEWLGYDAGDAAARTADAVARIRAVLRSEPAATDSPPTAWGPECGLRFRPLRPDPPLYVAAHGSAYLRVAGAVGDGAMPMATPAESVGLLVDDVRNGALAAGRDPDHIEVVACLWLCLSEQRGAIAGPLRQMIATFGPYLEPRALATIGLEPADFEKVRSLVDAGRLDEAAERVTEPMLRLALVGTPDEAAKRLAGLAAAGVTNVSLGGPLGPDPAEAIRLIGERIAPALR